MFWGFAAATWTAVAAQTYFVERSRQKRWDAQDEIMAKLRADMLKSEECSIALRVLRQCVQSAKSPQDMDALMRAADLVIGRPQPSEAKVPN